MIHQKDSGFTHRQYGGQVSKTISHYKIIEKLGEGGTCGALTTNEESKR